MIEDIHAHDRIDAPSAERQCLSYPIHVHHTVLAEFRAQPKRKEGIQPNTAAGVHQGDRAPRPATDFKDSPEALNKGFTERLPVEIEVSALNL